MDWKAVDERLIRRGGLLLSLDFLDGYEDELRAMNGGKVGRPYALTDRYMEFLSVVRYLLSMPYRQLEGFTRSLNRLIPRLPSADIASLPWVRTPHPAPLYRNCRGVYSSLNISASTRAQASFRLLATFEMYSF